MAIFSQIRNSVFHQASAFPVPTTFSTGKLKLLLVVHG